jgi:hypothetical protein
MTEQQLLRDYGGDTEAPILYKDRQLGPIPVLSKGEICPGYIGQVLNRDQYGFVGFREHREHFHVKMGGYALSERVLRSIRTVGVQVMLIAEEDTGRVYEWHLSQWRNEMPQHGKSDDEKDEDQSYAEADEAWGVYDDHTQDVMIGDREVN